MNEKLKNFLETQKENEKKRNDEKKKKSLLALGLYEKVYSPDNNYSEEFNLYEYDNANSSKKYYKIVPIEITDEEYQEVKKYSINRSLSRVNLIANAITIIAWIIYIGGFIAGIALGNVEVVKAGYYAYVETEFSFAIAFSYWCIAFISGTMFLGFASIIKLLDAIRRKK